MPELKVPSLQHLARNWRDDPIRVRNILVRLATNPPRFNYNPLFAAIIDLFGLHVPYDQVVEGISRGVKLAAVRENLLGYCRSFAIISRACRQTSTSPLTFATIRLHAD